MTVLYQAPDKINSKGRHIKYWVCQCECGTIKVISRSGLTSGDNISCGCYHREHLNDYGKTHGMSHTKIYKKWKAMIQRCTNPNADHYYLYGARGITVCKEWSDDFYTFYNWAIEHGYQDDLSIDRIDNNKGYCPENCRWITLQQQANNRRCNHYITFNGVTKTLSQWSRLLNVNIGTLHYRVEHGNMQDFYTIDKNLLKENNNENSQN